MKRSLTELSTESKSEFIRLFFFPFRHHLKYLLYERLRFQLQPVESIRWTLMFRLSQFARAILKGKWHTLWICCCNGSNCGSVERSSSPEGFMLLQADGGCWLWVLHAWLGVKRLNVNNMDHYGTRTGTAWGYGYLWLWLGVFVLLSSSVRISLSPDFVVSPRLFNGWFGGWAYNQL